MLLCDQRLPATPCGVHAWYLLDRNLLTVLAGRYVDGLVDAAECTLAEDGLELVAT